MHWYIFTGWFTIKLMIDWLNTIQYNEGISDQQLFNQQYQDQHNCHPIPFLPVQSLSTFDKKSTTHLLNGVVRFPVQTPDGWEVIWEVITLFQLLYVEGLLLSVRSWILKNQRTYRNLRCRSNDLYSMRYGRITNKTLEWITEEQSSIPTAPILLASPSFAKLNE